MLHLSLKLGFISLTMESLEGWKTLSRHHVAGSWESSAEYARLCFVNVPNGRGKMWRRSSTWSAAGRLQNDFLRRVTWHARQPAPSRWQTASAEDTSALVQTTFALRFSLSSEILAFRRQHRPNAEQLNCWVYAFKLMYVSSYVELTVCRVDCNPFRPTPTR